MKTHSTLSFFVPELFFLASIVVYMVLNCLNPLKKIHIRFLFNQRITSLHQASFRGYLLLLAVVFAVYAGLNANLSEDMIEGIFIVDRFAYFLKSLILILAFATVFHIQKTGEIHLEDKNTLVLLINAASFSLTMLSVSLSLNSAFIFLSIFTITFSIMQGFLKQKTASSEASIKFFIFNYFILGVFAIGAVFLIFASDSVQWLEIKKIIPAQLDDMSVLTLSFCFFISVSFFYLRFFPFHFIFPDLVQGAPTSLASYSTLSCSLVGFCFFKRWILDLFPENAGMIWKELIPFVCVLTICIGHFLAYAKKDLRRWLGSFSVTQFGFGFLVLALHPKPEAQMIAFFSFASSFCACFGLFFLFQVLLDRKQSVIEQHEAFNGLLSHSPYFAMTLILLFLNNMGLPPTLGFLQYIINLRYLIQEKEYLLMFVGIFHWLMSASHSLFFLKKIFQGEKTQNAQPNSFMRKLFLASFLFPILLSCLWLDSLLSFFQNAMILKVH